MDANDYELKIQALREGFRGKIAEVYDHYEDKVAELRVQLTKVASQLQDTKQELEQKNAELNSLKEEHADVALEKEDAGD
jgi:chromosome segregation ATPase